MLQMFADEVLFGSTHLARIIHGTFKPDNSTFYSAQSENLQVGHIVYPAGAEIIRHVHLPIERHIVGTSEVIIVQKGSCEVDIYSPGRELVATRKLKTGDILVTLAGGHSFRMLEDTVLLEIKQGPYIEGMDKERF